MGVLMEDFLKYRKAIAFLASAAIMFGLKRYGMSPEDLSTSLGFTFGELQEGTIDFMMTVALPAWFGWAWPNDPKRGIFDYWRVFLSGLGVIGVISLGAYLL
jgi:hypothetical protein